jgi:serine/threonine-protein kinase
MVGKTVGKYRILERIGRGGMGTVYRAIDETLDRYVAVKVLNADFGDSDLLKRFRAEALTLARLNHPGIATIYELHRQDDQLMMVMEFVRGETFHQLAERVGPLDPPQAAHLCIQVLDALGYAHRAGVIHRDLKPANLMVTETGAVKVMDFGIARVLGTEQVTLGGLTMGTPAYMAPEQVSGQIIDARADLYAVGVVFYRMLAGRLPFLADTAIAMAQKQVSDAPTPLAEIRPDLPHWCTALVERALAKTPAARFQSADDFRVALSSAVVPRSIGELPTMATPTLGIPTGRTEVPVTVVPARESATPTATTPPRERTATTVVLGRTHLFALAGVLVLLAIGIVVLAYAVFQRPLPSFIPASGPPPAVSAPAPEQKADVVLPADKTGAAVAPTSDSATAAAPPAAPAAGAPAGDRRGLPPAARPTSPRTTSGVSGTPAVPPPPPAPATEPVAAVPPPEPATNEPAIPAAVAFGNVRVLMADGNRARDKRGVLRIGNGEVVLADAGSTTLLTPIAALKGIFLSRSRQPRWLDENGKTVVSRVDLGPLGFFRGDRNWFVLITGGDPVILSVEDPLLQSVIAAFQARTGLAVRRVQ